MMKRIVCILLVSLMLFSFVACAKDPGTEDNNTDANTVVYDVEDTDDPAKILEVPQKGVDGFEGFGGKEIVILQRGDYKDEFYSEKETGQLIPDAVYKRNQFVQDYLGVTLGWAIANGRESTEQKSRLDAAINNGDEVYHISANFAAYAVEWIGEGYFKNLNGLAEDQNYLSPEKVWWNQSYSKEATIYGKQFFMVGDATTTAITRLEVLAVNETLLKEYVGLDINDLLNKVYDRTWTYETFLEYVESVGSANVYGASLQCNATSVDGFLAALAVPIVERTEGDAITLNYDSEKTADIANALRDLYQENEFVYSESTHMYDQQFVQKFTSNSAIFYAGLLGDVGDHFKKVSFKYAVMPMPIWDDNQAEYRSAPHDEYSILGIPINVTSLQETTAVMEVMAAESYRSLRPALCEKAYQYRYLATPEKAKMFDYIVDNTYYDCGYIYSMAFGGPVQWLLREYVVYDANSGTKYIGDLAAKIKEVEPANTSGLNTLLNGIANAKD